MQGKPILDALNVHTYINYYRNGNKIGQFREWNSRFENINKITKTKK